MVKLLESRRASSRRRRRARRSGFGWDNTDPGGQLVGRVRTPLDSLFARAAKRTVDVVVTAPLLVLVFPLLVFIAVVLKCVSRGPVLYGQVRIGQGGQPFRMWKFRTMIEDAERRLDEYLMDNPELLKQWSSEFKLKEDPRVIPGIGRVLRLSSLDELPQLWNVLVGEMSLVGPRPLPKYHLDQFEDDFRCLRAVTPPGITGQWQVCSRNYGAPEMFRKWDRDYVLNWSLWRDLWILCRTPWVVITGNRRQATLAAYDVAPDQ